MGRSTRILNFVIEERISPEEILRLTKGRKKNTQTHRKRNEQKKRKKKITTTIFFERSNKFDGKIHFIIK